MPIVCRSLSVLAAAAAVLAAAPAAQAQLVNGSFDAAGPDFSVAGSYCYLGHAPLECGSVPGWTGAMPIIQASSGPWQNPSSIANWQASQGGQLAGLQNQSAFSQTLTLAAGGYTLSWVDANRAWGDGNSYLVKLDGTTLGTFGTQPGDAWTGRSVSFTTLGGSHALSWQGLRSTGDGTTFIDSIALVAQPVPEPQVALLMAIGLAGLALVQRQRSARG
jgi:hypothetical protein